MNERLGFNEFVNVVSEYVVKNSNVCIELEDRVINNDIKIRNLALVDYFYNTRTLINMNKYYNIYLAGKGALSIAEDILSQYKYKCLGVPMEIENNKGNLVYKVVNLKNNTEYLKDKIYIKVLDLALVLQYIAVNKEDSVGLIDITKDIISYYERKNNKKVDLDSLFKFVILNTERVFEPYYKSIDNLPMYVLSNVDGINGASAFLYKNYLKKVCEETGYGKFIIMPSSTEEVILFPITDLFTPCELREVVININKAEIPAEQVLSNNVYFYDSVMNNISILH